MCARAKLACQQQPLLCLLPCTHLLPQGWIARTGLQYGADFVLYQRHPALAHSDYTVLVIPLAPGHRPGLGWHDLQIANRLSSQVQASAAVVVAVATPLCAMPVPAVVWRALHRSAFSPARFLVVCRSVKSCCSCTSRSSRAAPTAALPTAWPRWRCTSD